MLFEEVLMILFGFAVIVLMFYFALRAIFFCRSVRTPETGSAINPAAKGETGTPVRAGLRDKRS
jgi:hypothetical protein